jgi:hypothetical protein
MSSESLINYIVTKYEIQPLIGNKTSQKRVVSGNLLRLLKCNILSIPKTRNQLQIWAGTDFQLPPKEFSS